MKRIAVIGCGNMGSAVVRGLLGAGWAKPDELVASHPDPLRAAHLASELGIPTTTSNSEAAGNAQVILLGIKPQIIKTALQELRGVRRSSQVIVSIAAGISTRYIETYTGEMPVVRCMPNLPVTVGHGATAIAPGTYATADHVEMAADIFRQVGIVEVVPEELMDAVTGLSGTGPMYVFHFLEAMADAGVRMGLNRDVATRLSMQTLQGAAELAERTGMHPAALKDQVTSPGGTAIAALHILRQKAFAAIVMDAVEAATRRSSQLGE